MARNLTAQGERGLYIKDTAGFLLTKQGQAMVNETFEANLPDALMPAALKAWRRWGAGVWWWLAGRWAAWAWGECFRCWGGQQRQ